ncbi:Kinesin-like protein kif27 [Entophlyctis luteolus]|nr:Kinesin-like protein kif27 [Entophlyctis luteolus]
MSPLTTKYSSGSPTQNVSGSSTSIYSRSHRPKPTRTSIDSTHSSVFSGGRIRSQAANANRWDSILNAPGASNSANVSEQSQKTDSEMELDDVVLEMEDRHTSGASLGSSAVPVPSVMPTAIVVSDSVDEFKHIFSSDNDFGTEGHHVTAFTSTSVPPLTNTETSPTVINLKLTENAAGYTDKVQRNSIASTPPQIQILSDCSTAKQRECKRQQRLKKQILFIFKVWVRRFRRVVLGKPVEHTGKFCICWCFALDIIHLALLILIPVQLAWTNFFLGVEWIIFYYAIDVLMLVDCWIQARINYVDDYGILVDSSDLILWRYIFRMSGIREIFFSLPWETMQFALGDVSNCLMLGPAPVSADALTFFRRKIWAILLFVKIFLRVPFARVYGIPIPSVAAPISRLIKCMFILMLIGHVDACLFWFMDSTLTPGSDRWIEQNQLLTTVDGALAVRASTQYLVSYLAALRSLVLKLRETERDAENIYVIFEFVVGILSYGTVFGNIHSILELMDANAAVNQAEEQHHFEMEGIMTFMREKKILPELQQTVRAYKELQWQKSKGLNEDHFFVGIPKHVQQEIKNFLYLDLVQKVPLFEGTDMYFQQMLAFKIRPMHILDGWTIFRKGDEGEEMYFIKSGKVEICSEDGSIIFVTLTDGAFFGEIALFESCHRTATARAKGDCELCTLSKDEFSVLMNLYPTVAAGIRETIRARKLQEEIKKRQAMEEAERAASALAVRKGTAGNQSLQSLGAKIFGGMRGSMQGSQLLHLGSKLVAALKTGSSHVNVANVAVSADADGDIDGFLADEAPADGVTRSQSAYSRVTISKASKTRRLSLVQASFVPERNESEGSL